MRYVLENILLSLIIPGPHKHKDLDSFLVPLILELQELSAGVDNIYNKHTESHFTLRGDLVLVSADGPASANIMGLKTPGNAKSPCHHCYIPGILGENNHYYIPHIGTAIDVSNLPLRTHMREIMAKFAMVTDPQLRTDKSTDLGIVRCSILLQVPTIAFPESFPLDLMHCILLNIVPEFFKLLGGNKPYTDARIRAQRKIDRKMIAKTLGEQAANDFDANQPDIPSFDYTIGKNQWKKIGEWQERSRRWIPAQLGQAPRPIDTRWKGYKAMEWESFLIRDGIALLSDLGDKFLPYLKSFQLLRRIYLTATSWRISPPQLVELKANCQRFVLDFENLFYREDPSKIQYCRINTHSLLHLGIEALQSWFPPDFSTPANPLIFSSTYRISRPWRRLLGYINGAIYWIIKGDGWIDVEY